MVAAIQAQSCSAQRYRSGRRQPLLRTINDATFFTVDVSRSERPSGICSAEHLFRELGEPAARPYRQPRTGIDPRRPVSRRHAVPVFRIEAGRQSSFLHQPGRPQPRRQQIPTPPFQVGGQGYPQRPSATSAVKRFKRGGASGLWRIVSTLSIRLPILQVNSLQ